MHTQSLSSPARYTRRCGRLKNSIIKRLKEFESEDASVERVQEEL